MIEFKTEIDFFNAESTGLKNNIIEDVSDWEQEKWNDFINSNEIRVIEVDSKGEETDNKFARKIRHKCIDKSIAIITWWGQYEKNGDEE